MSSGICGVHRYRNMFRSRVDGILDELKKQGATVDGSNPWKVDTRNHGVILLGTWDERSTTLQVEATDKNWYVPCSKIWDTVDPLIHHLQALAPSQAERAPAIMQSSGGGLCGVHDYPDIDQGKIDLVLEELKKQGSAITGNNPWDVDTRNHGVKLRGTWNKNASTLQVTVTGKNWYVPCSKVWDTIDPLIHQLQTVTSYGLQREALPLQSSPEGLCGVHNYPGIEQDIIGKMLEELKKQGATVTGNNPWEVDTRKHGVKFRGTRGNRSSALQVVVTDKNWYVPCSKIWDTVDPLIHGLTVKR